SRPSVEDPERRGDPTRHAWLAQRLVGHGPAMEKLDDGRAAAVREVMEDRRPDAERGGDTSAVELVRAIDGEELGGRAGNPHHERVVADVDPVVCVGEPVGQRAIRDGAASPGTDPLDDLLDGNAPRGSHGGYARPGPSVRESPSRGRDPVTATTEP